MTNHPNRSRYRYARCCPRGFANEITYVRVPLDKADAATVALDRHFDVNDTQNSASWRWTQDARARQPGVAFDWSEYAAQLSVDPDTGRDI